MAVGQLVGGREAIRNKLATSLSTGKLRRNVSNNGFWSLNSEITNVFDRWQ